MVPTIIDKQKFKIIIEKLNFSRIVFLFNIISANIMILFVFIYFLPRIQLYERHMDY